MTTDTASVPPPAEQGPPTGPASARPVPGPHGVSALRPAPPDRPSPADALFVRAWWDPELARTGLDPRSAYVERFWLGLLGPSTTLLLRRLARGLEAHPGGFRVSAADTARALGLGTGGGRNGPLNRTLERACTFGLARRDGPTVLVRTHLPRLNRRQVARLPRVLQDAHREWERTAGARDGSGRPPAA